MQNSLMDVVRIKLHSQAATISRELVNDYAVSLLLQAKIIAFQQKADIVTSNHINEAQGIVNRRNKINWFLEVLTIFGSALLGAFIQGFVTELSNGNAKLLAVYTIIGFIGMMLIFIGITKK